MMIPSPPKSLVETAFFAIEHRAPPRIGPSEDSESRDAFGDSGMKGGVSSEPIAVRLSFGLAPGKVEPEVESPGIEVPPGEASPPVLSPGVGPDIPGGVRLPGS